MILIDGFCCMGDRMSVSVCKYQRFYSLCKELGVHACVSAVLDNARRKAGRDRSPSCPPRTAASEMRPYQSDLRLYQFQLRGAAALQVNSGYRSPDPDLEGAGPSAPPNPMGTMFCPHGCKGLQPSKSIAAIEDGGPAS